MALIVDSERGIEEKDRGIAEAQQVRVDMAKATSLAPEVPSASSGSEVSILIDPIEIFTEIATSIKQAQYFIYISAWVLDPDTKMTKEDTLSSIMISALNSNPNLKVYVLWSRLNPASAGGAGTPEVIRARASKLFGRFLNKRGKVLITERRDFDWLIPFIGDFVENVELLGSRHEKLVIVDGRIAFCGSANIHEKMIKFVGFPELALWKDEYHEVTARLTGNTAKTLERTFAEAWNQCMETRSELGDLAEGLSVENDYLPVPLSPSYVSGGAKVLLSNPERDKSGRTSDEIKTAYIHFINNAKQEIIIDNQYLMHKEIASHLRTWIGAGKDRRVKIIVPHHPEEITDINNIPISEQLMIIAWYQAVSKISEADVKGRIQPIKGVSIMSPISEKPYIHAKLMITDPGTSYACMIVGSANLDQRGLDGKTDTEAAIAFFDVDIINETYVRLKNKFDGMHLVDHDLDFWSRLFVKVPDTTKAIYPLVEFLV